MGKELQKAYNAIILLYDMKYEGHIQSVSHEAFHIDFVCSIKLQEM